MSEILRALGRLRAFLFRARRDDELDAELAAHIDIAIDEYIERGMTPDEARRRALIEFGGVQQAREIHRETRGIMNIDILLQDLKYTIRTLARDPSFTCIAVLILALAIGANIAVFSVVNQLMLRPLPFPSAQQLVWIAPPPTKCGLSCATYSTDAYDEFRSGSRPYQDVTGYFAFSSPGNLSLSLGSAPIQATSIDVIANFFQLLGVQPAMGRTFTADDARNGASPSSSSATHGGNGSSMPTPASWARPSTSMATRRPSSASSRLPLTSAPSSLRVPKSTPLHPSISTVRRATGAISSP